MIFGGYDQKRFEENSITFPFDANDDRKPSLSIQSIVTQRAGDQPMGLLEAPVYTLLDFAEPQLWLPKSACDKFAEAFNLTYDETTDLYLIDAATRARHVSRNPTITFGLGQTAYPASLVNIVLPYSAFDQQASYPIYDNATNYFPIRRAYNDTQYTLGRTFFQEAYIKVDYERGNFSVHQALFPSANEQQVVEISPKDLGATGHKIGRGLSKGAIAGISIGSIIAFTCILSFLIWIIRRRMNTVDAAEAVAEEVRIECADQPRLETDGSPFHETDGKVFFEKESKPIVEVEGAFAFLPELPCIDLGIGELDVIPTPSDLSTVDEVFELADEGWFQQYGEAESDIVIPCKSQAPPGWI